jgi:hypothetical protein
MFVFERFSLPRSIGAVRAKPGYEFVDWKIERAGQVIVLWRVESDRDVAVDDEPRRFDAHGTCPPYAEFDDQTVTDLASQLKGTEP